MLTDLLLAALHHLLFFAVIAMLAIQSALLRGPMDASLIRRLAAMDMGYGISAMALLAIGALRVAFGLKRYDFYLHNPWFHAKIGCFLLVGLISILPTVRFLRWRKALRNDPAFLPPPGEAAATARWVRAELLLIAPILVFAAMMARYGGF